MQVILAKTAGFCYGVERAVRMAEAAAREGGCVMLGSIIHNAHVVQGLAALGARQVDDPAQVQAGDTVIIRSHGVPKRICDLLLTGLLQLPFSPSHKVVGEQSYVPKP